VPNDKHVKGTAAELSVARYLVEIGYYVYSPVVHQMGPIDLIAVNEDGDLLMLDAKSENTRVNPNRRNATRINRVRSSVQKELGVQFAYVNDDKIHIAPDVPKINLKRERKEDG